MARSDACRHAIGAACSSAMTGGFWKLCRAPPCGSIAGRRDVSSRGSRPSKTGATRFLEEEESERHRLDRKIVREDQWMHGGVTGRRKRNVRRVRELRAMRQEVRDQRRTVGNVRLDVAEGEPLRASSSSKRPTCSKSYGGRPISSRVSTLRVMRGDRLGIVGPNGAGKTTLLKLLTGEIAPDRGTIRHGANLEDRLARPEARRTQSELDRLGRADRRPRRSGRHQRQGAPRRELHEGLSISSRAAAIADTRALGRRARRG